MILELMLLAFGLLNYENTLIEQGDVSVDLADLDAYVYLLPSDKRAGFVTDVQQIEKNIVTLLNMNIVYDYVHNTDLKSDPLFANLTDSIEQLEIKTDDEFISKLGVSSDGIDQSARSFLMKKKNYQLVHEYIEKDLMENGLEQFAKEYFLINKSQWLTPEKRQLSVIVVKDGTDYSDEILGIFNNLVADPTQVNFDHQADTISEISDTDESLLYTKSSFNYPFADVVFNSDIGLVPSIFKHQNKLFIVRVNEIIKQVEPIYDDVKLEIKNQLIEGMVEKRFQNIINLKAIHEIEVNPELLAHVFERYKVFIDEK